MRRQQERSSQQRGSEAAATAPQGFDPRSTRGQLVVELLEEKVVADAVGLPLVQVAAQVDRAKDLVLPVLLDALLVGHVRAVPRVGEEDQVARRANAHQP
jgi:hypothetical protein